MFRCSLNAAMMSLALYVIFFVLLVAIGWRLRQRKGRIGAAAVGSVYEMLNEERRNANQLIVEDKAAQRDPEHADGIVRSQNPKGRPSVN